MDKLLASAAEAVGDVPSGASLAVGGFGLCGIPSVLISGLADTRASDLEVVSNNCGVGTLGLGLLLYQRRVRRVIATGQGLVLRELAPGISVEVVRDRTRAPIGTAPAISTISI